MIEIMSGFSKNDLKMSKVQYPADSTLNFLVSPPFLGLRHLKGKYLRDKSFNILSTNQT